MPIILQIDEYTIAEVEKIKKYALEHTYGEAYRKLLLVGDTLPVGDNPDHVIHIHDGYRAVYSVTEINLTRFHHLSLSVQENGKYPSIQAAEIVLELFGMGNNILDLDNVWVEESNQAINFLKEI